MSEIILSGPEGRLEAKLHKAEKSDAPVALVLHPHPLYGGTMNNKVVYNLYHSLASHLPLSWYNKYNYEFKSIYH